MYGLQLVHREPMQPLEFDRVYSVWDRKCPSISHLDAGTGFLCPFHRQTLSNISATVKFFKADFNGAPLLENVRLLKINETSTALFLTAVSDFRPVPRRAQFHHFPAHKKCRRNHRRRFLHNRCVHKQTDLLLRFPRSHRIKSFPQAISYQDMKPLRLPPSWKSSLNRTDGLRLSTGWLLMASR